MASDKPAGFLPPAVAKNFCPPPPPWMSFPHSLTILPASTPISSTKFLEI